MSDLIDSKVPWIGKMPSEWNIIRFKDKYKNKKEIAGNKSLNYERIALTLNGVIKRPKDDSEGLQPKDFDTYQIIEKNDFVFKMIDLQNISTSRVGLSPYTGLVSPAYLRFSPKNELENTEYMKYYLMCLYYNCVFNNLGGDGVRSSLSAKDMGQIMCPYPNDVTQDKIVTFLNTKCSQIDELIAIQEQEIEKLKAYKQSLITEVVTKGLDPDVEMKDSGVDWITKIPKNWETKPIKTLFTFSKGLSITKEDLQGSGAPVISYGQIHAKWNSGVTLHEELKRYVSESYFEIGKTSLAHKGDFIFADTSEDLSGCGNCAYIDKNESVFAGYHTVILRPTQNFDTKYLAYLFLTDAWRSQIRQRVYGIKLFSVTQKILKNLSVVIPDNCEPIVKFLDEKCAHIDLLVSMKEQKISFLNNYRKSLIYEYVTGKKEV